MKKRISVLLAASEALPFIKTGGLADVMGALPRHLLELGARVSMVIPCYREILKSGIPMRRVIAGMNVPLGRRKARVSVYKASSKDSGDVYLIRHDPSFGRPHLYGPPGSDYPDNAGRFSLFSKAATLLADWIKEDVDLVHCHDWQTALIPLFLERRLPCLFTIHNIGYQGIFPSQILPETGIDRVHFNPEGVEYYGRLNLLKAGVIWSDAVTAVSPRYAEEIQTKGHGFGLDGLMRKYSFKLHGILNGADYSRWDPAIDPFTAAPYGPDDLEGKSICKKDLLSSFGIHPESTMPVIGMTTRLAHQKGIDILLGALPELMKTGLCLVILGSGDDEFGRALLSEAGRHPGLKVRIGFDEATAHRITAGSDMFLMPSRYEPCGLSQMYCLKYGTVPVVRATGGLKDTVEQYDPETGAGTGFLFDGDRPEDLTGSVLESLVSWGKPALWRRLMRNGMSRDFSWKKSAGQYIELYGKITGKPVASSGGR